MSYVLYSSLRFFFLQTDSHQNYRMGGEKFGFFYQPDYEKKKKIEEKEATAYRWSALADGGGPAAAPWTCAA
jgi:hypothetical protein